MPLFDAIFWDMDGTIVDTEGVVWEVMQRAFRVAAGIELPQEVFSKLLGQSELDFYARMAREYSLKPELVEQIRHAYDAEYLPRVVLVPPLAGAVEKVRESAAIAPIALVTGSTSAQASAVLGTLEISHLFRDVVACDMYEHGKPNPQPYLMALANLGVEPVRCLAIEDSPSGVTAAKAAGMKVVGVHEGNKGKARIGHADMEIASLPDLDFTRVAALWLP